VLLREASSPPRFPNRSPRFGAQESPL
jgi:hypothetical protein